MMYFDDEGKIKEMIHEFQSKDSSLGFKEAYDKANYIYIKNDVHLHDDAGLRGGLQYSVDTEDYNIANIFLEEAKKRSNELYNELYDILINKRKSPPVPLDFKWTDVKIKPTGCV